MYLRQGDCEAKHSQVTCHRVNARFLCSNASLLVLTLAFFVLRGISLSAARCFCGTHLLAALQRFFEFFCEVGNPPDWDAHAEYGR